MKYEEFGLCKYGSNICSFKCFMGGFQVAFFIAHQQSGETGKDKHHVINPTKRTVFDMHMKEFLE